MQCQQNYRENHPQASHFQPSMVIIVSCPHTHKPAPMEWVKGLDLLSCCCDQTPRQKQLKREKVYSYSWLRDKVRHDGEGRVAVRDGTVAGAGSCLFSLHPHSDVENGGSGARAIKPSHSNLLPPVSLYLASFVIFPNSTISWESSVQSHGSFYKGHFKLKQ